MTGIFFIARLGSTRLGRKHLLVANGRTMLEWLVDRFLYSFQTEIHNNKVKLFIVTSDKPENKEFEKIFEGKAVEVFYGSDANIPLRQLQCAQQNNIDSIISIDGDDILCSTRAAWEVYQKLLQGTACAKTAGLPLGMNVCGYQVKFLETSLKNNLNSILETGWGRIFNESNTSVVPYQEKENYSRLRMTLDYPEDGMFFTEVITTMGDRVITADDDDLIDFIIKNRFYELNDKLIEQYWKNFETQKKTESDNEL
jgi:spore coat polysaccharide biosynthesis protein SpsF (cytidylyltransferase family)